MRSIRLAVFADLHIQTPLPFAQRCRDWQTACRAVRSEDVDALCVIGDLTDHGGTAQLSCVLTQCRIVQQELPVLLTLGNHDLYHYFGTKQDVLSQWQLCQGALGRSVSRIYELRWIQGFPCVLLNSAKRCRTDAYLDIAQRNWLRMQVSSLPAQLPIFILHHQPLSYTHRGSEHLGLGKQDQEIKQIIMGHTNVIWVSGHIHNGPDQVRVLTHPYGIQIDVPAFQKPMTGGKGCGLLISIEADTLSVEVWDVMQQTKARIAQIKMH